jgi:hypothetical protein
VRWLVGGVYRPAFSELPNWDVFVIIDGREPPGR